MKTLTVLIALLSLPTGFAADNPEVELVSFIAAGTRTRAAELCGRVTGISTQYVVVKVIVDPNTQEAGHYNILVGSEGRFCSAVITYHGTVEASVDGFGSQAAKSSMQIKKLKL